MVSFGIAEPALRAAGLVCIWNTDVLAGLSVLDEGAAALMAGNAGLAGERLPLEAALGRTHPDDRDWVLERIRRARRSGGPISTEFRVLNERDETRWMLVRGTLVHEETGVKRGHGIYIDTTDAHPSYLDVAASTASNDESDLIAAADRCILMHNVLKNGRYPDLNRICELLMMGIGRTLARRIS